MESLRDDRESSCARVGGPQARIDLEGSVDRYRWLVENSVDVIAEVDVDGIIRFASPAVEWVLGYRPEEVLGTCSFALIHPDDVPKTREAFGFVLQNPSASSPQFELRLRHKDGAWRYVEALGKNVTSESNQSAIVFCLRDVTAHKQAEAALAARTQQLDAIRAIGIEITRELDLAKLLQLITRGAVELVGAESGGIYLWDEEAQMIIPHAYHGTGWLRERFPRRLGEGLMGQVARLRQGMLVNEYRTSPLAHPRTLETTGITAVLAEPLLYRDRFLGVIAVHHEESVEVFTAQDQELLALFAAQAAIAIENARLFQEEQQRREQLEAVRVVSAEIARELDLGRLLDLILRRAIDLVGGTVGAIFLWDEVNQHLIPQAQFGEFAAVTRNPIRPGEGMIGRVAATRKGLVINDYPNWEGARPELRPLGLVAGIAEPLLFRDKLIGVVNIATADKQKRFSEQDNTLLRLFADQAAIAIENAQLFQEQQRSFVALQRTQAELVRSEQLRGLGQMAAGIAHDLNNTLAAVLGQAELLRLQATQSEVQEGLALLETAAADGAAVVRRLQDFARQRAASPLVPMDLAQAVQEALKLTRPRWQDELQQRGKTIAIHSALGDLSPILGHAPEIREVLTNLIFNAVDAMPDGGRLTLAGATTPSGITLTVTDTGVGMAEEVRQKIFEPFFTTKGVKGTGLGLAVVYSILERHGGRVNVTSAPGQGTTVTLHFQAAPAGTAAPSAVPPLRPAPRRLLLIDDETTVRTTMGTLLRAVGHEVTEAENGLEGLASLADRPVDLVITDLGMPEMTGWEVARQIKATHPHLPVILLTGWGQQTPRPASGQDCVDRVLGKPIRLEALQGAIAALTGPGDSPHHAA